MQPLRPATSFGHSITTPSSASNAEHRVSSRVGQGLYQRMQWELSSPPRHGQTPCWPPVSGAQSGRQARTACVYLDVSPLRPQRQRGLQASQARSFSGQAGSRVKL